MAPYLGEGLWNKVRCFPHATLAEGYEYYLGRPRDEATGTGRAIRSPLY